MKARIGWISLLVLVAGLIAYRVLAVRQARSAPQDKVADTVLVQTARVGRADLDDKISFTGSIRPRNEVDVFTKVPGRVESVTVQVGDRVREGRELASVEHKEITWQARTAQAAVQLARANLEGAKLDLDRAQTLFKGGSGTQAQLDGAKVRVQISEAQVAQAEAAAGLAQQQVANSSIVSPISGAVTRRLVNVGAQVGPQAPAFTIQDLSALKLEASVDAAAHSRIEKGKLASVTVDELVGQTFEGRVTLLSPSLDSTTRRASIEIQVDNASGKLLPNMFARAEVTIGKLSNALVVPRALIVEAAGGAVVYRVKDGKVEMVKPQFGATDGKLVVVESGLAENDELAASSLANLSHGLSVKVVADAQVAK